jgi:hypothetical protein
MLLRSAINLRVTSAITKHSQHASELILRDESGLFRGHRGRTALEQVQAALERTDLQELDRYLVIDDTDDNWHSWIAAERTMRSNVTIITRVRREL